MPCLYTDTYISSTVYKLVNWCTALKVKIKRRLQNFFPPQPFKPQGNHSIFLQPQIPMPFIKRIPVIIPKAPPRRGANMRQHTHTSQIHKGVTDFQSGVLRHKSLFPIRSIDLRFLFCYLFAMYLNL